MEAAVLSAAVSGVLKIVGNKLAPLLVKEYSSIVGVNKDLQKLHAQVVEINNWLENKGDKVTRNNPSSSWLKEWKDIAYAVDDVVDEFQLETEKHEVCGDGGIVYKYTYKNPESIIIQCKAASKVKKIKKRLAEFVKQRTDFSAITNSLLASNSVPCTGKKTGAKLSLPNVDEASVLGRDQEKHQIISKLIEANDQQKIKIVSVIGLGGSGKTTLAQLVFNDGNDIEKHFKVRRWVHVSQEFDVEELIKKLFEAISGEKSEHCPVQKMSEKISEELSKKRFLLVLDDVWTEDRFQWEEFMVHLKRGAPGSAILLTTRNRKVAETVGSTYQLDLPFLSEDDSWKLFQKSLVVPAKGLEVGFVEVGTKIVKKCGGVPLAIKALAGVLHGKERIEQWQAVRDNNLLDVEGQEGRVSTCLRLSYLNLPSHLKQCFTICSLFPKGYQIEKEQLIDLWIAHDMITPVDDGVDYLEGYECFNSLVQMAFLQDVHESYNGRVRCTMHDLVHDLARSIMDDEISLDVPKQPASSTKNCRYFSLTEWPRNYLPKNHFEKARAVYVDRGDDLIFGKALKNARHLRSVDFMWTKAVPIAIFQLKNLKYLNMSGLGCSALPEVISNVWSLQALHVPDSDIVSLPESIGRLQKLRILNLSGCGSLESLPDSIGDCHMISSIALRNCTSLTVLPNSIGRNKRLRVLRLGNTKIERLPSSITTLENLECLDLCYCYKLVELPECFGNLKKLEVLNLEGCRSLRAMPVGIGQLPRLQTSMSLFVAGEGEKSARISELGNAAWISGNLTIRGVENVTDPDDAQQACLKQKTNLQCLDLEWECERENDLDNVNAELEQAVLDGLEPPSGIKRLDIRGCAGGQYARWMLKQAGGGAQGPPQFTCLTVMRLSWLVNIKHLEGLVELPCLEELELRYMRSLESISGGPFPSLVKLSMWGLDRLREVWMVTERMTLAGGEEGGGCSNHLGRLQIGSRLSHLSIWQCPELIVKPYLPSSLEYLKLYRSNEQQLSLGQGSSCSSSFQPCFSFSHLKELGLGNLTKLSSASPSKLGSGHGWDLLQHMMALESLNIIDCDGLTELPESMRSLTSLQSLRIQRCYNLFILPEWIGELRSLQEMNILDCHSLSSLPQSMGHLTSLRYLRIEECSKLRSLGELRSRCRLSSLPQSTCHLTSLQELRIERCDALHQLPEWLGELRSLREFRIDHLPGLTCLPLSMCLLTSLEKLQIINCDALHQLPEWLGELRSLREFWISELPGLTCLPQSMCRLTSLEELYMETCAGIKSLPESLGELRSLRVFGIWGLPGLTCLPQSMCRLTSLEQLRILNCPGIKSLPEWIKGLTALRSLIIHDCPDLARRCERGKGEDWHLISHIPFIWIR
ncbi:disease resistance protein RGA2-like [Phragmites australis]|uniref:disease resistance protein RGA2-like n=1 Tax=Phragmites australis TaxID=29695 RepID=UPI002D78ED64|nr:disease resistance protein RGA2-like [Phragmites australis]XP_062202658.1 disease resistance protein RGA2-like [Phragmites australis]XP_062202659.1 disease resistance protein RGA2-like [Phragmites australis]XP_062202660.1 disease resistance protein RGA2-like [Phragmites australis]XP_062202661.1 disease resistance protein RGA2-like [Phragmites australis]